MVSSLLAPAMIGMPAESAGASGENLAVYRYQALGVIGRPLSPRIRGQLEKGKRPYDERPRLDARVEGLTVFRKRLVPCKGEFRPVVELVHDIVIVCVEPFPHREGLEVDPGLFVAASPGHSEIPPQRRKPRPAEPRRNRVDKHGRVEHLVVEGKTVTGDHVDPAGARPAIYFLKNPV